jgi:hypothetical protein
MPYSIVMLLRSPFIMSEEILKTAASKAFGVPYDGSNEMYFVGWHPRLKTVKAGPSLISALEAEEPYLGDPAEVAQGFKNKRLEEAWIEHRTWVAFDLMNREVPKRQAYVVLAKLVAEPLDARCAGIYLPKENQFTIESDGSALEHLRRLAGEASVSFRRASRRA